MEQLRRLNNELEDAHISLETQLYRDLDLKDRIIQELTVRFNSQASSLSTNMELVSKLRREIESCNVKLKDQSKFVDLETSYAAILQKLRLSESAVETLENNLKVLQLQSDIATEELLLSTVFLLAASWVSI